MRSDLKPCPFCGDAEHLLVEHLEGTVLHPAYRVWCDNCGASSAYTDNDHVGSWNRRADLSQPAGGEDAKNAERYRHVRAIAVSGRYECMPPEPDEKTEATFDAWVDAGIAASREAGDEN